MTKIAKMINQLTKISTKLLLFFALAYMCFACRQSKNLDNQGDTKNLNNKIAKVILSDSLVQKILENKLDTLPMSILQFFSEEPTSNCLSYKIEQVNLDEEDTNEIILFVMYGNLQPNDIIYILKKDIKRWQIFDEIHIYTQRGNLEKPFLVDNQTKLLITQSLGWGLGYGATFNNFHKMSKDSLTPLLSLVEDEWAMQHHLFDTIISYKENFNCVNGLQGNYQIIDSKNIIVDYNCYFWVKEEEKEENEVSLLDKNFQLSYQLDSTTNSFELMPNQKVGEKLLQTKDDMFVMGFFFFEAYQKDIEDLRKSGTEKQRYYLKYFNP